MLECSSQTQGIYALIDASPSWILERGELETKVSSSQNFVQKSRTMRIWDAFLSSILHHLIRVTQGEQPDLLVIAIA